MCCVGRATRLVQFLVGLDKEYVARVRLGYATDTQDPTGKQITPLRSSNELSLEDLQRVLDQFTGPQLQTPPMFSARKVGGERLYRAAREGREVEREPANITVYSMELVEDEGPAVQITENGTRDFRMRARCTSGTYIRTLAHGIGERLGVGAHLIELRRTAVGHFRIGDAMKLEEAEAMSRDDLPSKLVDPSRMLSHLPVLRLDDERIGLVKNGRAILLSPDEAAWMVESSASVRLCDHADNLSAVGDYDSRLKLVKPRVVLAADAC